MTMLENIENNEISSENNEKTTYYNGDTQPIQKIGYDFYKYINGKHEKVDLDNYTYEDLVEIDKDIWDKMILEEDEILLNDQRILNEINLALYPEEVEKRFLWLIEKLDNKATILIALDFIKEKHEWQFRKENTPYWAHCVLTAIYTIENGWSNEDVIVALLHDTVEDQYYEWLYDEIEELFWKSVLEKVIILSKERKGERISNEEYYKWVTDNDSCSRIKWADRLSNIYWLYFGENKVWNMKYLEKTRKEIFPIIIERFPDLAFKIDEAIKVLIKYGSISEEHKKRIEDLKKIRELKDNI